MATWRSRAERTARSYSGREPRRLADATHAEGTTSHLHEFRNLNVGIHVSLIVHARDLESEEPQEIGLVAAEVREFVDIVARHLAPQRLNTRLHVGIELLVIRTQTTLFIEVRRITVHAVLVKTVDLLDAAFVRAFLLHHLEEQRQIQRHHRNRGTGLRDDRLEHRDARVAALGRQFFTDAEHLLVEVFLGRADRTVPVDVVRDLFAEVGERGRLRAVGEHAGVEQGVDPHLPVFAAHHRDGVVDLGLRGRLEDGFLDDFLIRIDAAQRDRLADRLQGRAEHFAGFRMRALGRGETVDNQIDLAEIALDDLDGARLDFVGKRVAVDARGVQAFFGGEFLEGGGVVPAGRSRFGFAAGAPE